MKINQVQYKFLEDFTIPKIKNLNSLVIEETEQIAEYEFVPNDNIKFIKTNIKKIDKLDCTWKETFSIELDYKMNFVPGDSIGLLCCNNKTLVQDILKILKLSGDKYYFIKQIGRNGFEFKGSLSDFFTHVYDFTTLPKKAWLMDISKKSKKNLDLQYLCSKEGTKDYLGMIRNWNNTIDILNTFECKPNLEDILMNCQTIKPRYYSLTNHKNDNCKILISTVRKDERFGHVSDFIHTNDSLNLKICHRESILFRYKNSKKILCIATGTGIAPFLSFLKNKPDSQFIKLIYGFRNVEDDLIKETFLNSEIVKIMSKDKKYVTDYILENLEYISEFVNEDCLVYACGRPEMQKKVYEIFNDYFPQIIKNKQLFFDSWF